MFERVDTRFYRISDIARMFGWSYITAWKHVKDGKFPSVKIGRSIYIPADFIEEIKETAYENMNENMRR